MVSIRLALIALLLAFCVRPVGAEPQVYRYVDDEGNAHYTQDPGTVPDAYRDRLEHMGEPDASKDGNLLDRMQDMFEDDGEDLPPVVGAEGSSDRRASGSETSAGATKAGGRSGAGNVSLPPGIDLPDLNDKLKDMTSPFLKRLVVASVAALETGLLWVVLLAIILFGFMLTTRRLISLEDHPRKRLFWKWGYPLGSIVLVVVLLRWRYPPHSELYDKLIQVLGI